VSRDIALLVNPTSGRGRAPALAGELATALAAAGDEVRTIAGARAEESGQLAREAVADGADVLVAIGGDGLVHLALQAVAGTGTTLGILPAGSGNDFARAVGVPLTDPAQAIDVIAHGTVQPVDALRVTTGDGKVTWVGTILAVGFDARVNMRSDRLRRLPGQLRYNAAVFAELASFRPLSYTLSTDGDQQALDAMLIAIGNGPWYGRGLKMCPEASLTDGELDLTIVHPVSRLTLIRIFPKVYSGEHVKHPQVEVRKARKVLIDSPGVIAYGDGERVGRLPATCEAVQGAVSVLAPATP
jgi:diacylglycerol kinase (ATP)